MLYPFHVVTSLKSRITNYLFSFVAVLFADALQRMFRITAEAEAAKASGLGAAHDIRAETNFAARKF